MEAQIRALQRDVDLLPRQRIRDENRLTAHIQHEHDKFRELIRTVEAGPQDRPADKMPPKKRTTTTTTTAPMTDVAIKALIAQGVADALVEIKAYRTSQNGDDSHDSRTGSRRTERAALECTYKNFLKCQPFNFKGTEGVVSLTQWFEKMESVFHISNCTVPWKIKFATCTLLGSALTAYTVGSGEKKVYRDPNLCALNATTIMMGSVLPSAPTVRGLAILPETIEANLLLPTTKEPQGQIKGVSLTLSTEFRAYAMGTVGTNPNSNVVMGNYKQWNGKDAE
ncbi:hypothetical protein Tco_0964093 [Tanacetum coccineum]